MNRKGIRVESLDETLAKDTGIRPGDSIFCVNGNPVEDELDYRFHAVGDGAEVEVQVARGGDPMVVNLKREGVSSLGFAPMRSRRCRNRCLFCFVDQLPDGLRPSLYLKDEDYRFSFLYGNYVTFASLKHQDLDRICRLKLQPLYVSVHATEQKVRNFLLGRKASREILGTLRILADAGITLHTQVVLCPGINDGSVLDRTLRDLAGLYPAVRSIAIVPVGLTRYRREKGLWPLRGVRKNDAEKIIFKIGNLQELFKQEYNDRLVYLADEFYGKAGHPFPPAPEYQDFPQWENGVGMVPMFYEQWEKRRRKKTTWASKGSPHCVMVTGESAYPYLQPYVQWLEAALGASLSLVPVQNRFLGRSVSVAGLIAGRDIVRQIRPHLRRGSILLVPDVMLNLDENRFIDDLSLGEIAEALSVPVEEFPPDPVGFEEVLRKHTRRL
jgi:putative radical SAM enzyme (TIGR03279 family)